MGKAIVIGASMAGLLAARALADRYEVEVIERDALPEGPEARKGVPQARHAHALLRRGAAQRTIAREVKDVWLAATGEDFRFEETKGPRPASARWIHKYLDAIFMLSLRDPQVQAVCAGVYLLDRPMTDLMSPSILFRALWEMLRGKAVVPDAVPLLEAGRATE